MKHVSWRPNLMKVDYKAGHPEIAHEDTGQETSHKVT
jgi:hypothetical protein